MRKMAKNLEYKEKKRLEVEAQEVQDALGALEVPVVLNPESSVGMSESDNGTPMELCGTIDGTGTDTGFGIGIAMDVVCIGAWCTGHGRRVCRCKKCNRCRYRCRCTVI